jgi:YHS domain-containing protein
VAPAAERGEDSQRSQTPGAPPEAIEPAIEVALDPVCGMEVAVTGASIQLERDGERYYFCSEGCRDSFAAEGAADAHVG